MRNRLVWGLLIGTFVLFSLAPTFYELGKKQELQGRSFELVHNYITDYHFYLSRIRQGIEGRWSVVEQYTNEPHQGSFIQEFYLLLGKADIHMPDAHLAATGAYHVARVVLGFALLSMIALWVRSRFSGMLWQILAFLVVVTACVWPHVVPVGESVRFGGPMAWWTLMDNLQRITFLPHLLAGQALMAFLLYAGSNDETLMVSGNWVFLGILAFVLGMLFPPGLVFLAVAFGVMVLLSLVFSVSRLKSRSGRESWILTNIVSRMMIGLISLPSLLYFSLMFGIYPWKRLVELDVIHPLPFAFPEYVLALGPTLPLGILGLILVFILRDRKFLTMVSWVVAWGICLFVFQYVPQQSPLRFSEMLPHVPLGILAVYPFYRLYLLRGKRIPGVLRQGIKLASLSVVMFLILLGLGVMGSSFLWQKDFIDQKIAAGYPAIAMNNFIVYPVRGFWDALKYLELKAPDDAVILSDMTAGNYIPPVTGRSAFVGHDNTVNLEAKLADVHSFFRGELGHADVFLNANRISYVFFGPQERESGGRTELLSIYPFLTESYRTPDVIIYTVR